jgi:hypothetical protein
MSGSCFLEDAVIGGHASRPGALRRIVPRQGNDCASAAKSQPHGAIVRSTTGMLAKTLKPLGLPFPMFCFFLPRKARSVFAWFGG